jgi:SAM-dependent methyltransferase
MITLQNAAKYVHLEKAHNLEAPSIIVPMLIKILNPQSVVDVGCGIGTFLSVFHTNGVTDIRGYDGQWVDREKLANHMDLKYFFPVDLEHEIRAERRFDLAICLEVAEHLKEQSANTLVNTLVSLSNVIVFAAAIPGQMGQNHINEQWPDYWEAKFQKAGYHFHDVFRPIFWDHGKIPRWYKQNMFLVLKKGTEKVAEKFIPFACNTLKHYVHPDYFSSRVKELEQCMQKNNMLSQQYADLVQGKAPLNRYLKTFVKAITYRISRKKWS